MRMKESTKRLIWVSAGGRCDHNVAPNGANITAFPVMKALSEALAPAVRATSGFSELGNGHNASIGLIEAMDCWLQEVGRCE